MVYRRVDTAVIGIIAASIVMGLLGLAVANKLQQIEAKLCNSPCTCTCP